MAGALAEAGHTAWEERLLFAAVRSLLGVPDVQDTTLRAALRKGADFEKTGLAGVWSFQGEEVIDAAKQL